MSDRLAPRRAPVLRRAALLAAAAPALALCACQNPFVTSQSDLGPRPPLDRLRAIPSADLPPAPDQSLDPVDAERDVLQRRAAADRMEITLEQVRAWTLVNNLDLDVALIDPTIANTRISEEEGRFEAVFFANSRYSSFDQPTASSLAGSQVDVFDADVGFRVPMRTGGSIEVALPFNRTQTDNPFTFLNPSYTSDLRLSISQPLLRGAGRRANTHGIRVAALESDIAQARTKLEVIRQIAAADRAYWRLYATRKALDVAIQQYQLAQTQLERARRLVRAGRDAEIEIIRAEDGVAARVEFVINADRDLRARERDLKRLVNVPELPIGGSTVLVPVSDPDPINYALDPALLSEVAIENRMELLELELQLAIDASTIDFERNQALPLFTVDYTYGINGLGDSLNNSLNVARNGDFADWILGLRAEIPLGNETARSRVARAVLFRLQRLATREARRLAIVQETLEAADNLDSGWRRILAARQSAVLAGRTFTAEQRQFEIGQRTSTDVLDAATRLADAQLSEIRAIADYQIAQVDLAFATGALLGAARLEWAPSDPREITVPRDVYLREGPGAAQ